MEPFANDAQLLELMQEKQTIVGYLDAVFGFLARCTDFYHMKHSDESIGLPPGHSEQLVHEVFHKWKHWSSDSSKIHSSDIPVPDAIVEVEVELEEEHRLPSHTSTEILAKLMDTNTKENVIQARHLDSAQSDQLPKPTTKVKHLFEKSEYFNGACYGNYCWSQSNTDVMLYIILPPEISNAKYISVDINSDRIQVLRKNSAQSCFFEGTLSEKCKTTTAMWSLDGSKLQINLDKCRVKIWDRLFITEPSIDLRRIDNTQPVSELSGGAQSAIHKLLWNEEQKQMGKPTSDQLMHHSLLREAWNIEGSPFSGTAFNPSSVQFE